MFQTEIRFLKNWMLPIAMATGITICLLLYFVPAFQPAEAPYINFASKVQPILIACMLFLQFNVVAPTDIKFHKWHFKLLAVQASLCVAFALLAAAISDNAGSVLCESAMLCFIAPTAAAAGVITDKLGGKMSGIITYLVMADCLASVLIPLMVPIVHPSADVHFLASFWKILKRVFSILLLPCVLAWFIRYTMPKLQQWLAKYKSYAFYIWGVGLTLAMSLATNATVTCGLPFLTVFGVGAVSLVCCLFQFWLGRRTARRYGYMESVTAGQALGQKNTGFVIWLGYNFLTPVTAIAGGLYAIWHNIVNSYELYKVRTKGIKD